MNLRTTTTLEWSPDALPPPDELAAITDRVFADLEYDIERPAQCVFSIVSLAYDDAGPCVRVTGDKTRPVFHCWYSATTNWS